MKPLRKKAEYLYKQGFNRLYFRLLLKQDSMSKEDKEFVEKLYAIVKGE